MCAAGGGLDAPGLDTASLDAEAGECGGDAGVGVRRLLAAGTGRFGDGAGGVHMPIGRV